MIDKNSKRNSKTDRPKTVVSNNYHSFFECLELSQLAGVFNNALNVINRISNVLLLLVIFKEVNKNEFNKEIV